MLWKKKAVLEKPPQPKVEKLPGPRPIPGLVQKHLITEWKLSPDMVSLLKAVVRKSASRETAFDIRVFDESEALARKEQVNDYTTLDEHPGLISYEGWFSDTSKLVELQEKKKVNWDTPLFTEAEIQQKIEALSEPGSTVFFYMARGGTHGGPLGMGATVIELNPSYADKKGKKYNIYTADVVDMQPVGKGQKLWDSNKPKDIARWVKDAHHKRMY
jgi:hypothetical protein